MVSSSRSAACLAAATLLLVSCGDTGGGTGGTGGGTGGSNGGATGCGDGVVDEDNLPFETCDDGNTVSGDGCSNACRIEYVEYSGEVSMTGTETFTDIASGDVIGSGPVSCTGTIRVATEGPGPGFVGGTLSCRLVSGAEWSFRNASRSGEGLSDLNITYNADFFPCQGEGLGLFGTLAYERDAEGKLTSSTMEGTFMKVCQRENTGTRSRVEFTGTFEAASTRIQEL